MRKSADNYFNKSNLFDLRIVSTIGLNDDDLEEIKKIDNVKDIIPSYTFDFITELNKDKSMQIARVHSFDFQQNGNTINSIDLIEGKIPENKYRR